MRRHTPARLKSSAAASGEFHRTHNDILRDLLLNVNLRLQGFYDPPDRGKKRPVPTAQSSYIFHTQTSLCCCYSSSLDWAFIPPQTWYEYSSVGKRSFMFGVEQDDPRDEDSDRHTDDVPI